MSDGVSVRKGGVLRTVRRSDRISAFWWWMAAAAILLSGCAGRYPPLPRIRPEVLGLRLRSIPAGAAPTYSWRGARNKVQAYWSDQNIFARVEAYFPPDWAHPGDGFWEVRAENAEGKPIPFIGVIHRYRNENGTEIAVLVPPFDLLKAPDGLYLVIDPNIEIRDGAIARIRPLAMVIEIRDHCFKPFRVKMPLFPEQESERTPRPDPLPVPPAGTPIPVE